MVHPDAGTAGCLDIEWAPPIHRHRRHAAMVVVNRCRSAFVGCAFVPWRSGRLAGMAAACCVARCYRAVVSALIAVPAAICFRAAAVVCASRAGEHHDLQTKAGSCFHLPRQLHIADLRQAIRRVRLQQQPVQRDLGGTTGAVSAVHSVQFTDMAWPRRAPGQCAAEVSCSAGRNAQQKPMLHLLQHGRCLLQWQLRHMPRD